MLLCKQVYLYSYHVVVPCTWYQVRRSYYGKLGYSVRSFRQLTGVLRKDRPMESRFGTLLYSSTALYSSSTCDYWY